MTEKRPTPFSEKLEMLLHELGQKKVSLPRSLAPQIMRALPPAQVVSQRRLGMHTVAKWRIAGGVAVLGALAWLSYQELSGTLLSSSIRIIDGTTGMLLMLASAILAVVTVGTRRYRASAAFAVLAICCFMFRSLTPSFFNTEAIGFYDTSFSIPDTRGAASDMTSQLSQLKSQQQQFELRSAEIMKRILERVSETEASVATSAPNANVPYSADLASESTERYGQYDEHEPKFASESPLSTFSIDVDTASYTNMRRFIRQGQLPPPDSVRVEEFVNYFKYDYPSPRAEPFGLSYEIAPSPFVPGRYLLSLGLKARSAFQETEKGWNLVFLVDVSGSMDQPDKLPLVKQSLRLIVNRMRPQDRIALVAYAGQAGIALDSTSGKEAARILAAIDSLSAGGSTHGSAGIDAAYALVERNRIAGSVNRVVLATDGDFNVGTYDFQGLMNLIERKRMGGITLTTLGFGQGNINDHMLEQLADRGNGNYFYIDSYAEARRTLEQGLTAAMEVVAKDVKLQVEFNPGVVAQYRLIGFDNRKLRNEDFANDQIDAGEVGSGHTVTAIYELILAGTEAAKQLNPALRYQVRPTQAVNEALIKEIAFLKVRYKEPEGDTSKLLEFPILGERLATSLNATSSDFRFAISVAHYGLLLRQSRYTNGFNINQVQEVATKAFNEKTNDDRREFLGLLNDAQSLMPHYKDTNLQQIQSRGL